MVPVSNLKHIVYLLPGLSSGSDVLQSQVVERLKYVQPAVVPVDLLILLGFRTAFW